MLYFIFHDLLQAIWQALKLGRRFLKELQFYFRAGRSAGEDHPRAVRDVCPIADHRVPDGGAAHAAAPGDKAISSCGITAKEDKKTSVFAKATPWQAARVGRVPGLILAQL